MSIVQLSRKRVPKVWGRQDLPEMFGAVPDEPIGEIWFEAPHGSGAELLVKYLFTSDKLSVQVHPDDESARQAGHPRGKEEAWLVLDADPGAAIGVGLQESVSREALRAAALGGSIESLLDWRPAARGDVYYLKAGTVHALGGGLTVLEIQQNTDLTYRLYDYGRPRELHIDEAVAVANPVPYAGPGAPYLRSAGREILIEGGAFVIERWAGPVSVTLRASTSRPVWLVAIEGAGGLDGHELGAGSVWLADDATPLDLAGGSVLLAAYSGAEVNGELIC